MNLRNIVGDDNHTPTAPAAHSLEPITKPDYRARKHARPTQQARRGDTSRCTVRDRHANAEREAQMYVEHYLPGDLVEVMHAADARVAARADARRAGR